MLGFIFATVGMIVAMFISSALFGVVPLVSIIGAFFTGGVAGIMGKGRPGAYICVEGGTFRSGEYRAGTGNGQ